MRAAFFAVAALAAALLLVRAVRVDLAGDYVDPILKIRAQDEALNAHSAIQMARRGDWMTPKFLGRLALDKPPLPIWTAAASARLFGIARITLRLPVALLAAFAAGLVFLWAAELKTWEAGAAAAILLAANHLWHVMGSMALADGLLAALCTIALYCLYSDPWLRTPWWLAGFSSAAAAAILTKGIAGVLPLAVLGVYWLAAPRNRRPTPGRVLLAAFLAGALAAPWFVYQLNVHGRWFRAEHLAILGFGSGGAPQMPRENQWKFYLARLTGTDPTLLALVLIAVPGLVKALRSRQPDAILLTAWVGVSLSTALAWSYRSASYLLPAIPALAIVAAAYSPLSGTSRRAWLAALAGLALMAKTALPALPWGIRYRSEAIQAQSAALSEYCRMGRGNELMVYGFDDGLYAAALPLPRIRYELLSPAARIDSPYGMPFGAMGITMEGRQFNDLARWEPVYRERLREWGVDSSEPIGSLIIARSADEVAEIIRKHPRTDFFLPEYLHPAVLDVRETHDEWTRGDHFFLLARDRETRTAPPAWSCEM
jgi:4-amino-4-deoxy-L-arabinose transferase-like glycosyltransferase